MHIITTVLKQNITLKLPKVCLFLFCFHLAKESMKYYEETKIMFKRKY